MPWEDLRYIFGEIMYGGHIVEDWDRRLCNAYLFRFMNESLLEAMEFYPGFIIPPNSLNHKQVRARHAHTHTHMHTFKHTLTHTSRVLALACTRSACNMRPV